MIKEDWSPSFSVSSILLHIPILLSQPNPDDPLNCDAAAAFASLPGHSPAAQARHSTSTHRRATPQQPTTVMHGSWLMACGQKGARWVGGGAGRPQAVGRRSILGRLVMRCSFLDRARKTSLQLYISQDRRKVVIRLRSDFFENPLMMFVLQT